MYFFRIMGEAAEGTLPDGTSFFVDAEDIPKVETQYWSMDGEGYVVSSNQHIRLHRYLLNVSDPSVMVDHINRNRKDILIIKHTKKYKHHKTVCVE